ncbi:hypothetical protein [Pseudomonas sp. GCEP-101]|uniref:hypothetical protein n=1 Tax=Pseudomonas sp. GCEP-101 TaxID=2974552 RepID=UPI00223C3DA9|nr:hypothetical protein [Pseudomonas sp. GCEP-101]
MALRGGPLKLRFNEGIFRPKRKTGCPGQAFWLFFGVWKSNSPEGAKHEAYAQTEAAQKLPARSKSIADKVRAYAVGNTGANLQERPMGAIAGMARSYREAPRAPMRHKKNPRTDEGARAAR